ncbi:hypothetical protein, partial [Streptomyces zhihengii]
MAGESPDKSEQRKSSGETTGSERDPRLAMFREGSPASPASKHMKNRSAADGVGTGAASTTSYQPQTALPAQA